MAMNRIQFQPGLSMPDFFTQYGTEAQCATALEKARWPNGLANVPAREKMLADVGAIARLINYSKIRDLNFDMRQCEAVALPVDVDLPCYR